MRNEKLKHEIKTSFFTSFLQQNYLSNKKYTLNKPDYLIAFLRLKALHIPAQRQRLG